MLKTLIGLIILLYPFLLVFKYKNKKVGFACILSFLIAFHLLIAIVTQALHIFTYQNILLINLLILLVVTSKTNFKEVFSGFKVYIRKMDWVLIFVLLTAFISLASVHYDYSGKITIATTPEYQEVKNMQYPYPYFSDEWYSIAFIKDSINSHSLPFKNPLTQSGSPFVNFEFAFHSFLSELILLLNLNPLTHYTLLTIFFNLLIVILVYIFLRVSRVNQLPAAITSLALLYITNGANLPGIWNLLPLNLGIISLLLSFFFVSTKKTKMVFLTTITALFFYPPLAPFSGLVIIFYIVSKKQSSKIQNVY